MISSSPRKDRSEGYKAQLRRSHECFHAHHSQKVFVSQEPKEGCEWWVWRRGIEALALRAQLRVWISIRPQLSASLPSPFPWPAFFLLSLTSWSLSPGLLFLCLGQTWLVTSYLCLSYLSSCLWPTQSIHSWLSSVGRQQRSIELGDLQVVSK